MSRERGQYGPLDRDRHYVIGWGGDRAIDYARDAALRPVMPAIDFATRASRGASRVWTGTRMMGGRDEAGKPPSVVGQELFHTIGDRSRALAQLTTGFKALANDLAVWQTSNKDAPDASVTAQWIAADVTPTLEEWKDFVDHEAKSWWTKLATSWDTFESWWNRLRQLRALARAHGMQLQSVEPTPLPKTIWQKAAMGTGSEATALVGVLKVGAATVLTIVGLAGLYAALKHVRSKSPQHLLLVDSPDK